MIEMSQRLIIDIHFGEDDYQHIDRKHKKDSEVAEAELEGGGTMWWYVCGECRGMINYGDKFCRHCGKELVWE
jgi:hypothetical protein